MGVNDTQPHEVLADSATAKKKVSYENQKERHYFWVEEVFDERNHGYYDAGQIGGYIIHHQGDQSFARVNSMQLLVVGLLPVVCVGLPILAVSRVALAGLLPLLIWLLLWLTLPLLLWVPLPLLWLALPLLLLWLALPWLLLWLALPLLLLWLLPLLSWLSLPLPLLLPWRRILWRLWRRLSLPLWWRRLYWQLWRS
jgi:hypothetical protein